MSPSHIKNAIGKTI